MKRMFLTAFVVLPALGWAQSNTFTIKAKVGQVNAPAKAYLSYKADGKNVMDSVVVKNGEFAFTGTANDPIKANLILDHKGVGIAKLGRSGDALSLYLEKGNINVNAADSIKKAKITGSKLNAENVKYMALFAGPEATMASLNAKYAASSDAQKKDEAFMGDLRNQFGKASEEKKAIQKEFVKNNLDSYLGLAAFKENLPSSFDVADVEPGFKAFSEKVRNTTLGKDIAKSIETARATSTGAMAPVFTQNDVNDKPVNLSDFKGKYVLIDFWASWCGPCRAENPNVVKAFNKFKDKNFTVLGVSLDQPGKKDAWLKAIADDGLAWTQVSDLKFWNNDVAKLYGVRSIPQNFLVDPNGKIVGKNLRGEELEKKLAAILGN